MRNLTKGITQKLLMRVAEKGVVGSAHSPKKNGRYDPIQELGADLLAFWDSEDAATITLTTTNKVFAWADRIGGYSPTQATDAARPVYNATGFNGRPCLSFAGAQELTLTGVPAAIPTGADECEIWYLGSQDQSPTATNLIVPFAYGNGSSTGAYRQLGRVGSSGFNRARVYSGTGSALITASGSSSDMSGKVVLRGRILATETIAELNGRQDGQVAGTLGGTGTTRLRFGAQASGTPSGFYVGTFNKLLITRPLDEAKAFRLRKWLADLGGVPLYSPFENEDYSEWESLANTPDPYEFNGTNYHNDSPRKSYNIMRHHTGDNFLRFEVREGDEWLAGDGTRPLRYDRAEFGTYISMPKPEHEVGAEQWYSWSMKARGLYSDGNRSLFQLYNDELELQIVSLPNSLFWRTYSYPDGTIASQQSVIRHMGAPMIDDVPENFVMRAIPLPGTGGELQVWRNGTELFNVTGIPMGTAADEKRHKIGIYRLKKPDPFVFELANFEWADGPLALFDKVANPDPWPTLWTEKVV